MHSMLSGCMWRAALPGAVIEPEVPRRPAFEQIKSKLAHDMLGGNKPWFDLGFGLNFELDTASLDVKVTVTALDHARAWRLASFLPCPGS